MYVACVERGDTLLMMKKRTKLDRLGDLWLHGGGEVVIGRIRGDA